MRKRLLLISLFFIFACHSQLKAEPTTLPIINGEDAQTGEFPWMVSIYTSEFTPDNLEYGHICGGALISPNYVLTAAHCADYILSYSNSFSVAVGLNKLNEQNIISRRIKGVIIHPEFNYSLLRHDLALLKLESPIDLPVLQIADLSEVQDLKDGDNLTILGWGQKDPNYPVLPNKLQTAVVPSYTDQTCSDELGLLFDPSSMLCAGKKATSSTSGDGVDSCYGDSGSPILLRQEDAGEVTYKAIGVTSWGFECGSPSFSGVYAELAVDRDWLLSSPPISPSFNYNYPSLEFSELTPEGDIPVGSVITCKTPEDIQGEELSFNYNWISFDENYNELEITGETQPQLYVNSTQVGKYIYCKVTISNRSGSAEGTSLSSEKVVEVPAVTPVPTTPPDSSAPVVTSAKSICKGKSCKIRFSVSDQEPSSGVTGVISSYSFTEQQCSKASKRRTCLKNADIGTLSTTLTRNNKWTGRVRINKRKGYLTLRAYAIDSAGNIGKPTKFKLKIGFIKPVR